MEDKKNDLFKTLANITKPTKKEQRISEMPYHLVEYINNKELINKIIEHWFEDSYHLLKDLDEDDIIFIKSMVSNCMISYRRLIHE